MDDYNVVVVVFLFLFCRVESDVFVINWVMFRGILLDCREAI